MSNNYNKGLHWEPFILYLGIGVLLSIVVYNAHSQEIIITGSSRYNDTSGGQVTNLPTKLETVVSAVYWYKEPQMGKIYLPNNDSIINYRLNLRLDLPGVEIYNGVEIKVLPLGLVHTITIDSSDYVTHSYFHKSFKLPTGFYEVLVEGKYSLVKLLHYKIQNQNYSPQFDVGNTKARAIKVAKFYILNSAYEVLDLTENRKKTVNSFFTNPERTKDFLKLEKIKLKNPLDLIKWIEYENTFTL